MAVVKPIGLAASHTVYLDSGVAGPFEKFRELLLSRLWNISQGPSRCP